jgi:hypothetical protein
MSVIFNFKGIGNISPKDSSNKNTLQYSNESAGWYAIAKDGVYLIVNYNTDKHTFYKNKKSWEKRVKQLQNRGY